MSKQSKTLGVGRVLIAVYAVFAISSSARAIYQLFREFDQAPLAYSLSAAAALIYVLATIALAKPNWRKLAVVAVSFELVGVLTVGALSYTYPELFAHPSVWSNFGQGYGFVPLVLPVLGLMWLRKTRTN